VTPEEVAGAVKLMYWDLNKAAYQAARGTYKRAQNLGMRYQNWKHKGAGESGSTTSGGSSGKKQWKSDEQYQSTTYMNTTTYRKREK